MIQYNAEGVELPSIISDGISFWITEVINSYGCRLGEINYLFCDDYYILNANKQFLNHDYFTDIITFDYRSGNQISGDLLISLDTVESNAKLLNQNFEIELLRVVIHGILHIIGLKDSTELEKKEMRAAEDTALKLLPTFH